MLIFCEFDYIQVKLQFVSTTTFTSMLFLCTQSLCFPPYRHRHLQSLKETNHKKDNKKKKLILLFYGIKYYISYISIKKPSTYILDYVRSLNNHKSVNF